jgi:hypothetical protein
MSQTWYRDFGICVKKHFRKEYNHFVNEAVRKRDPEDFRKGRKIL